MAKVVRTKTNYTNVYYNESTKKYERVESERKEYLKSLEKTTSDDEYDDMNYI